MYIETVPNRNSPPAILLREGWREGQENPRSAPWPTSPTGPQTRSKPCAACCATRRLVSPQDLLTTAQTSSHGHVEAILVMIRQLGLEIVIASKRRRERDLVVAMIVQRLIDPRLEAGHHPRLAHHDLGGRIGGGGCHRGRTLRRPGLAVGAPGAHREKAGRSPSHRGWPGALRRVEQFSTRAAPARWRTLVTTATARRVFPSSSTG